MEKICKLDIKIDVLAPMVLTSKSNNTVLTTSADVIKGSIIRGTLAGMYIRKYNLQDQAHLDKSFQELFLNTGIRYLPATPVVASQCSNILPMSIMQSKITKEISDGAYAVSAGAGWKSLNGYGAIVNGSIHKAQVYKTISLHMSRNQENERISGKSLEGHIYNYEAIKAGQSFICSLLGTRELLEKLLDALNLSQGVDAYIGRSKYNQYGRCRLSATTIQDLDLLSDVAKAMDDQGFLTLYCTTPYIPDWSTGDNYQALSEIVQRLSRQCPELEFQLADNMFIKTESIANYVGVWNLRRDEEQAISAGSLFKIKCIGHNQWPAEALQALVQILSGTGARRNQEGYGQFRLWPDYKNLALAEEKASQSVSKASISPQVAEAVANILMNRFRKEIRQMASMMVMDLRKSLAGKNHLFGRLENILENCYAKDKSGCRKLFQQAISKEIREKSQAERHLHNIRYEGSSLLDILKGSKSAPWWQGFSWDKILGKEINQLAKDINYKLPEAECGELYHEYWLWFFRHARKLAAKAVE